MKANELRGRAEEDLRHELEGIRKELFDLRFNWQAQENPDTSHRRKLKRNAARILTVLHERALAAQTDQAPAEA